MIKVTIISNPMDLPTALSGLMSRNAYLTPHPDLYPRNAETLGLPCTASIVGFQDASLIYSPLVSDPDKPGRITRGSRTQKVPFAWLAEIEVLS